MTDLRVLAGNKAKARAAAKELTIPELENLISGFSNALIKLKEEESVRQAEEAKKAEAATELAALIAQSGLTLDEIVELSSPRAIATKGKTVEPRYRLEVNGEEHLWTGRGRTPILRCW